MCREDPGLLSPRGFQANWTFGFPGQGPGVMEEVVRLASSFLVDGFEEGVVAMDTFYDCVRAGTVAGCIADRESLYGGNTAAADMVLSDSVLTWHVLQGVHISEEERRLILPHVGGDYSRYNEVKVLLSKSTPCDKTYVTMWADGATFVGHSNNALGHESIALSANHSHSAWVQSSWSRGSAHSTC